MSDIAFNIPAERAQLLSVRSTYYVKHVLLPADIIPKLKETKASLQENGGLFIVKTFDVFYSILHHAGNIRPDVIVKAYGDLNRGLIQLANSIDCVLDDKDSLSDECKAQMVNSLKMLVYMYTQYVSYLEKIEKDRSSSLTLKAKTKNEEFSLNKVQILSVMNEILQREINLFWDPPVVEHEFIALFADTCYLFLHNPTIKQDKELRRTIFLMFGNLIKTYDYGSTFVSRLILAIRTYDHVVLYAPEGVKLLVEEAACKGLVHQLVKEATEWQIHEDYQDTQGTKCCSTFIAELAVLLPNLMIPEVTYLNQYLTSESPPLRISVLNVITEVILKVLTKFDLSEEEKEFRDEFVLAVAEHMTDVSSLVRVKAIQNIGKLQKESAIPVALQNDILMDVIEHCYEKVASVRKAAVNCISIFLEYNPFGASLQLKKAEEQLGNKQELLLKSEAAYTEKKLLLIKEAESAWQELEREVEEAIKQRLDGEEDDEEDEDDSDEPQQVDTDTIVEKVRDHLKNRRFADALKLCDLLRNRIDEWKNVQNTQNVDQAVVYKAILHGIFMNTEKIIEELRFGVGMTSEDIAKIQAVEKIIKYLDETITFLRILGSAVKPMRELLFAQTISDMHEAINFFILAYKFGIDDAANGIMEMLKLIRYDDPDRKKAVVEAFKVIYLTTDSSNMEEHTTTIVNRLIEFLKETTYDNLEDFQAIVTEWTAKGILDNGVIDRCWQYYTKRVSVSDADSIAACEILAMCAMGRSSIITKNFNVVVSIAFSEENKNNMKLLEASCRLLSVAGLSKIDIQSETAPFKITYTDKMFQTLSNILVQNFFSETHYYSEALYASLDFIFRVSSKPFEIFRNIIKEIYEKWSESEPNMMTTIRLCQIIGNAAVQVLAFLDNTVYRELKRRNFVREACKENKSDNKRKTLNKSTKGTSKADESKANESVLLGADAEDSDAEFILHVLENEIVSNCGVLGHFRKMLQNICEQPDQYSDPLLQEAAVVALMRFMLVSSKVCRDNIRLIFTIVERSEYPEIKCAVMIHCADLLIRFHNIVEPWSPKIYTLLKDPIVRVRQTALIVLANLILRDMIMAHSHISEIAACMYDDNEEIRSMCCTFFRKLAEKGSNLANVIPDIFSHLVKMERISEENLRNTMKFLFDLVDNFKRTENLVDRFCCKYMVGEDLRLNRNITYCLSLIQYNEKALKKLHEKFPLYKHHVHDAEIYQIFKEILEECRKTKPGQPDLKTIVADIETCIGSVFDLNEDGQPMKPPPLAPKSARKPRQQSKKKKTKKSTATDSDDSDSEFQKGKQTKKRNVGKRRKKRDTSSDSE